jgi:hypothetical protein
MTLIFATAFNRPDFIELQHRLFERFLEDDYEFCIVSDADTVERRSAIRETCDRLGIRCHQVPQEIHDRPYLHRSPGDNYNNPNVRHCNSVQWAWDSFLSHHDGPVMVIDSDMFLIRPFSIERTLEHRHLAGVYWGTQDTVTGEGKSYLWLALILFNNPRLPERETICFNCGVLPHTSAICDSGGWTNLYLDEHREVLEVTALKYQQGHEFFCPYRYAPAELQNFDHLTAEEIARRLVVRGFTPAEVDLALQSPYTIELLGENQFLHYRAGTNYENYSEEELAPKDKVLLEFFDRIVSE